MPKERTLENALAIIYFERQRAFDKEDLKMTITQMFEAGEIDVLPCDMESFVEKIVDEYREAFDGDCGIHERRNAIAREVIESNLSAGNSQNKTAKLIEAYVSICDKCRNVACAGCPVQLVLNTACANTKNPEPIEGERSEEDDDTRMSQESRRLLREIGIFANEVIGKEGEKAYSFNRPEREMMQKLEEVADCFV